MFNLQSIMQGLVLDSQRYSMPVTDTSLALSWHYPGIVMKGNVPVTGGLTRAHLDSGSILAWEDSLQGNDEIERQKWLHVVMWLPPTAVTDWGFSVVLAALLVLLQSAHEIVCGAFTVGWQVGSDHLMGVLRHFGGNQCVILLSSE